MTERTAPLRSSSEASPSASAPEPAIGRIVTIDHVREHPRVKVFIRKADEALAEIGYTEHGERHVGLVSHIAYNTLKRLGSQATFTTSATP